LFAFARITVLTTGQTAAVWEKDIEAHQRIIDIVREGPGELAEQYVHRAMARFGRNAYDSWEKKDPSPNAGRSRRRRAEELPAW
jgi:DNA-binding GntR family transcriptional regulator